MLHLPCIAGGTAKCRSRHQHGLPTQPSPTALTAIYRHYRRRLASAIARGLALQLTIYALERRVAPPSAAALRAAYPQLLTPAPYTILGLRSSTTCLPKGRAFFRKESARSAGR